MDGGTWSTITQLAQADHEHSFGSLLASLRVRRGLSARALSEAAGKSPSYASKMERGEFLPTVDTFSNLVSVLGCTDAEVVYLIRMLNHGSSFH